MKALSAAVQPAPRRQPSRLERAIGRAVRGAAPYGTALAAAVITGLMFHQGWLPLVTLGAAGMHAAIRLHEAHGWHRRGGKAAMRRRRRFQGTATSAELRRTLSLPAVRRRARITRPSLTGTLRPPATDTGVLIGTGGRPRRSLYGTHEDFYAVFGPARSGKTGWMAGPATDAPGACLIVSTRTDMWAHTSIPRSRRGPVLVLNPAGDGGIPTTFTWNPLEGCEDPAGAISRAGYMMAAAPKDTSGRDAWWDAQGARLLRLMLHAGALAGASMTDVARWCAGPAATEPATILAEYPLAAPGWAAELDAITEHDGDYTANVSRSAATALDWLSDPAMAAIACPHDSWEGFSARQFLAEGGTVYLIGTDRPHNSLAPYFATFTAHLFDTAKAVAAQSPGGRCDPPLTLVIDEPAITCPVPLDRWSAEAGGHGITVVTGFQSRSQLAQRWGAHGAETIWNNATVKLIYGGFTHADDLEAFSRVCGERDTWDRVTTSGGGRTKSPRQERLFPPEQIRLLPEGTALVLHRRTRPLLARITSVWERPGYEPATPGQRHGEVQADVPASQPELAARPAPPAVAVPGFPPALGAPGPIALPAASEQEEPAWPQADGSRSAVCASRSGPA